MDNTRVINSKENIYKILCNGGIYLLVRGLKSIQIQIRERGLYISLIMNIKNIIAFSKSLVYKIIYPRNINSNIFFMEQGSKFEIFNKKSKVYIGKCVFIRRNSRFRVDFDGRLEIGDYTFINDNCNINCVNSIFIGDNCKIASGVCINDHDHNYKKDEDDHLKRGSVSIGNNVWIGANTVILRDSIIGDNAVIAAGSVVKGNIPPNTVYYLKREENFKTYVHNKSDIDSIASLR